MMVIQIDNMSCGACVRRVTQTLNKLPGTHADEVRVGMARVTTTASVSEVTNALAEAGYPARVEADA